EEKKEEETKEESSPTDACYLCCKILSAEEVIYHCPKEKITVHMNGYDLCIPCAAGINQQKPTNVNASQDSDDKKENTGRLAIQKKGQAMLLKRYKNSHQYTDELYAGDVKCYELAAKLIDQWNNLDRVEEKYKIIVPIVARRGDPLMGLLQMLLLGLLPEEERKKIDEKLGLGKQIMLGETVLVEDFLVGDFVKWNSNSGWIDTMKSNKSIQAFCHWTYHQSEGKYLFCDAQVILQKNKLIQSLLLQINKIKCYVSFDAYVLTDPCIVSLEGRIYGITDMGKEYLWNWFRNHKCNDYCEKDWMKPDPKDLEKVPEEVRKLGHATSYVPEMSKVQDDQLKSGPVLCTIEETSKTKATPKVDKVEHSVGKSQVSTNPPVLTKKNRYGNAYLGKKKSEFCAISQFHKRKCVDGTSTFLYACAALFLFHKLFPSQVLGLSKRRYFYCIKKLCYNRQSILFIIKKSETGICFT
ncbi:hypothetical protein RFI_03360, partial [Reticulomyxa filosa]